MNVAIPQDLLDECADRIDDFIFDLTAQVMDELGLEDEGAFDAVNSKIYEYITR